MVTSVGRCKYRQAINSAAVARCSGFVLLAGMGYRRLETLTDLAGRYWLLLKCRCGHQARFNPMVVVGVLQKRRDASYRLDRLHRFLKCGRCGGKDFTAEHCEPPEIWKP